MTGADVKSGLSRTFSLLTETANEAAVSVLLAALDSPDIAIQNRALQAILDRRRGAGQRVLIERWHGLSERWKLQIARQPRQISPSVRHAILSSDAELCVNGCSALLYIREFELIPALVTGLEEPGNPQATRVAETLVRLCELLQEEISGPRDKPRFQDPVRICELVLPSLEKAVERFESHRCRETMEAFLLLASRENALLNHVLAEPRHPAYLTMMDILCHSPRLAVIRLVLNLLECRFAPSAALQVVAHRADGMFMRQLLKRADPDLSEPLRWSLRRVESMDSLICALDVLDTLSEKEQAAVVRLAMASHMNRLNVFRIVKQVLTCGRTAARRVASAALGEFGGAEANQLVLDALQDPDPQVQATVLGQLRERGIPGAITHLIHMLDSPHDVVRQAARGCLMEFTFHRYITQFDLMDNKIRTSTGMLVMRIDPDATTALARELKSNTRTRRLRGLEAAVAMDAVYLVEPLIIGLLNDPDHYVRTEAAGTLAYCNTPLALESLRNALRDRSVAVREAAEQSLQKLSADGRMTTAGSLTLALRQVESSLLLEPPPMDARV
ncbi:MAG: HEAT repeat domain-containing protein [Pirellulaceae bacterium]